MAPSAVEAITSALDARRAHDVADPKEDDGETEVPEELKNDATVSLITLVLRLRDANLM
jgi:hypothetical protein